MSLPRAALIRSTAALVLALAMTGCGADTKDEAKPDHPRPSGSNAAAAPTPAPSDPSKGTSDQASEPAAEVPELLQFEASTIDGASFDGASVAGKPVVIWFWAPWCAVCRSQAPEVTGLAEEYAGAVTFLGVGSLDSGDAIASFGEDVGGMTQLSDPDGKLYQRFGIAEQSSFVVLDAEGNEVLRTGYADDDELAGTVADLAS